MATDAEGRIAIAWEGNVNHVPDDGVNVFARTFDTSLNALKNDFRIDLADRGQTGSPAVVRGPMPKLFTFAWRDDHTGSWNAYTRTVDAAD